MTDVTRTIIEISGTPIKAGTFSYSYEITDSNGTKETLFDTIVISSPANPLTITGDAPSVDINGGYTYSYIVDGGIPGYVVTLDSGALPPGLSLDPSGTIYGTATLAGIYNYVLRATDAASDSTTIADSIAVETIAISGQAPDAITLTPYNFQYGTTGSGPFVWSIESGSLPYGLTLNTSTGEITGIPTTAGIYNWTIKIVNSSLLSDTKIDSIEITEKIYPLQIYGDVPNWVVNRPLTAQYGANGGVPNYAYTITAGALPDGTSLNITTGKVTGLPTTLGTYNWTVQVEDSQHSTDTLNDSCEIYTLPDMPLLAAGYNTFTPDNNPTNLLSFDAAGVLSVFPEIIIDGVITNIFVQSDGKYIIIGSITIINGINVNGIARITKNGAVDTTFSGPLLENTKQNELNYLGGKPFYNAGIMLPDDTMILTVKNVDKINGQSTNNILFMLNSDGSINNAFHSPNIEYAKQGYTPDGPRRPEVRQIIRLSDNSICVAGLFDTIDGHEKVILAKLQSDGQLDLGFTPPYPSPQSNGSGGYYDTAQEYITYKIVEDPNTKNIYMFLTIPKSILGLPVYTPQPTIIQVLDSQGNYVHKSLFPLPEDSNYGSNNLPYEYYDAIIDGANMYITGAFRNINGITRYRIARISLSGDLDMDYNPNISNYVAGHERFAPIYLLQQPNGKMVIFGQFNRVNSQAKHIKNIARLNVDGTLDDTFTPNQDIFNNDTSAVTAAIKGP